MLEILNVFCIDIQPRCCLKMNAVEEGPGISAGSGLTHQALAQHAAAAGCQRTGRQRRSAAAAGRAAHAGRQPAASGRQVAPLPQVLMSFSLRCGHRHCCKHLM